MYVLLSVLLLGVEHVGHEGENVVFIIRNDLRGCSQMRERICLRVKEALLVFHFEVKLSEKKALSHKESTWIVDCKKPMKGRVVCMNYELLVHEIRL